MYTPNRIVSRRFRERTLQLYPDLAKSKRMLALFEILVFSTFVDDTFAPPRKVLSRDLLLDALELPQSTNSREFKALDLLEECRGRMPELKLDWDSSNYERAHARTVTFIFFSLAFRELLRDELSTFHTTPDHERVRFITGDSAARSPRQTRNTGRRRAAPPCVGPAAASIADYLNSVPRNAFSSKVKENIERAMSVARTLPQYEFELVKLHQISSDPKPHYAGSARGSTVRLFANGVSMLGLKNEVKYALIDGWRTFDLRSSQLAIVATDWGIPYLQSWLQQHDPWEELCNVFSDIPAARAKGAIKTAVYSACYGAEPETIAAALRQALGVRREEAFRLLRHELLIHLLGYRHERLRELVRQGGAVDCFGNAATCSSNAEARSVLAQLSQAREMQLLLPAVELAKQRPNDFRIMLWEHDGFSVHFRRDQERNDRTERALLSAVNDHCATAGYPTVLVAK